MEGLIEKTKALLTGDTKAEATRSSPTMTTTNGAPVGSDDFSQTVGPQGPMLVQDIHFFEKMAALSREPVPPRVVHAKGAGAYGTFKVTADITKYTIADLFSSIGKETPVFVRFSIVFPGADGPDTIRDTRGFAVKFYTNDGNWDLVGNNFPVFFVRDSIKFPDVVHCQKKDPRNNTVAPLTMWDFFSQNPESLHHVTMLFSDRGTPMSFRHMHGFGANTFSFVNKDKEVFFFKVHFRTQQGIKNFTRDQAEMVAGQDRDFHLRDLYSSIEEKNFPKWKMYVQVMPEKDAWSYRPAFDVTKTWNYKDYPLIEVGVLELNSNPTDHHAEVEQVAFSPANVVPGISFSPDRILQGRLFAYSDAQRYRIGINFPQLPVNRPRNGPIATNQVGGLMLPVVENKFPNFYPSSLGGPVPDPAKGIEVYPPVRGEIGRTEPVVHLDEDYDFYKQPGDLFRLLSQKGKLRLADNIAASLETVPDHIVKRQIALFSKCDEEYGRLVEETLTNMRQGKLPRDRDQWIQSAAMHLLKDTKSRDKRLPAGDISIWPEQYHQFNLKLSPESQTVSHPCEVLTGCPLGHQKGEIQMTRGAELQIDSGPQAQVKPGRV